METTGNAGGVRNLNRIGRLDRDALIRQMDTGPVRHRAHGQRHQPGHRRLLPRRRRLLGGARRDPYPVEEITIAGNLKQMFVGLVAVGNDCDYPGSTRTGSWLIDEMTIAGK